MQSNYRQTLSKYLPANSVDAICKLIVNFQISLRITSGRKTKLGDYRSPVNGHGHKISVNGNLYPDVFLLVFLHELAHLLVWKRFKNKVNPHGKEWKDYYGELIRDFINRDCFREDIHNLLLQFSYKPKATFAGDIRMWKQLKQLNSNGKDIVNLDEIPAGTLFKTSSGRLFKKDNKIRTRIRCMCLKTKRWYLFHPLADILPIEEHINY
ncbi:MAG: SprT-like domain-containing protein [Bacteroidales bacterium]